MFWNIVTLPPEGVNYHKLRTTALEEVMGDNDFILATIDCLWLSIKIDQLKEELTGL